MMAGYLITKIICEQLIQKGKERGLPACIYRTARIMGQSNTGIMGSFADLICLSWRSCVLVERCPIVETKLNLIPVDFASKAIGHLSRKHDSMGRVFHVQLDSVLAEKARIRATSILSIVIADQDRHGTALDLERIASFRGFALPGCEVGEIVVVAKP